MAAPGRPSALRADAQEWRPSADAAPFVPAALASTSTTAVTTAAAPAPTRASRPIVLNHAYGFDPSEPEQKSTFAYAATNIDAVAAAPAAAAVAAPTALEREVSASSTTDADVLAAAHAMRVADVEAFLDKQGIVDAEERAAVMMEILEGDGDAPDDAYAFTPEDAAMMEEAERAMIDDAHTHAAAASTAAHAVHAVPSDAASTRGAAGRKALTASAAEWRPTAVDEPLTSTAARRDEYAAALAQVQGLDGYAPYVEGMPDPATVAAWLASLPAGAPSVREGVDEGTSEDGAALDDVEQALEQMRIEEFLDRQGVVDPEERAAVIMELAVAYQEGDDDALKGMEEDYDGHASPAASPPAAAPVAAARAPAPPAPAPAAPAPTPAPAPAPAPARKPVKIVMTNSYGQ